MWKDIPFAPGWQVTENGDLRRRVSSKHDSRFKEAIDEWLHKKPVIRLVKLCVVIEMVLIE